MSDFLIENIPLTKEWLAELIEIKIGVKPKIGTIPQNTKGCSVVENAGGGVKNVDHSVVERFMHNTECNYYKLFSSLSEKPLQIPTTYLASKAGEKAPVPVIVLEMLEDCKLHDLIPGFNEDQLFKIVDELVKLHIFSLTTEKWKEIVPDESKLAMSGFLQCMVADVGRKLAQNPELGVILSYVENTLDTDPNYLQKMRDEYINEERPSVICHGDLWAPQILWDKEDNIAGIVDWQATHRGSPMEDLHHILSTCTSVQNRKTFTKPLLDHYYNKLKVGLKEKGFKTTWTREEIDIEYNYSFIYGASRTIFANGFWANSPVLQTDGKPDPERIKESFVRCKSYLEDTIRELNII
ncbi:CHK kinase-like domain-containing protein [Caenorhabditis elegans]|uniref:CHK kinase-like domain-containing protein n=1 Tax=Caenorhabditis elegans TaxID=6239 RepID=H9G308_CAEEL|nr:CHK kinase-like domain-containing protein [Caenorhabditis elegans]CCG28276.1 CHK kinase-like domain-containing protein [Caenorhabditis elegans]|eukprot:NP_001256662.1 Nuclear Hormone Receptor family [Caenorhabditis elegans]